VPCWANRALTLDSLRALPLSFLMSSGALREETGDALSRRRQDYGMTRRRRPRRAGQGDGDPAWCKNEREIPLETPNKSGEGLREPRVSRLPAQRSGLAAAPHFHP